MRAQRQSRRSGRFKRPRRTEGSWGAGPEAFPHVNGRLPGESTGPDNGGFITAGPAGEPCSPVQGGLVGRWFASHLAPRQHLQTRWRFLRTELLRLFIPTPRRRYVREDPTGAGLSNMIGSNVAASASAAWGVPSVGRSKEKHAGPCDHFSGGNRVISPAQGSRGPGCCVLHRECTPPCNKACNRLLLTEAYATPNSRGEGSLRRSAISHAHLDLRELTRRRQFTRPLCPISPAVTSIRQASPGRPGNPQ
jgi:hypothetical protein